MTPDASHKTPPGLSEDKYPIKLVDVERMLGELYEEAMGETSAWYAAVEADPSKLGKMTSGGWKNGLENPCGFSPYVAMRCEEQFEDTGRSDFEKWGKVNLRWFWNVDLIDPDVKRWLSERGIDTP